MPPDEITRFGAHCSDWIAPIPDQIVVAVMALLSPYFPGLTAEEMLSALNTSAAATCLPDPPVLDKHTACRLLNISIATLNRLIRDRQLRSVRIRGSVRIPAEAIRQLMRPEGDTEQGAPR